MVHLKSYFLAPYLQFGFSQKKRWKNSWLAPHFDAVSNFWHADLLSLVLMNVHPIYETPSDPFWLSFDLSARIPSASGNCTSPGNPMIKKKRKKNPNNDKTFTNWKQNLPEKRLRRPKKKEMKERKKKRKKEKKKERNFWVREWWRSLWAPLWLLISSQAENCGKILSRSNQLRFYLLWGSKIDVKRW